MLMLLTDYGLQHRMLQRADKAVLCIGDAAQLLDAGCSIA